MHGAFANVPWPREANQHGRPAASRAATTAVDRALEDQASGDSVSARLWFERAHRLAPDDPVVLFLLASTLSAHDVARSLHLLDTLLRTHPSYRSAHISRAALLDSQHRAEEASVAIDRIISTMAAPADTMFRVLADRIAISAGRAGWVGITGGGRVLGDLSHLRLTVDGARIAVSRGPTRSLAHGWRRHAILHACGKGGKILGCKIDIAAIIRIDGVVDLRPDGTLAGWAHAPNDPDTALIAEIFADTEGAPLITVAVADAVPSIVGSDGLMRPRGFQASLPRSLLQAPIHVRVNGQTLLGSPLRAMPAILTAHKAVSRTNDAGHVRPATMIAAAPPARRHVPCRAAIDVIIPLHRGAADFRACLASLAANRSSTLRVVCIDDGIADPALRDLAVAAAGRGDIILLRHPENRGFPAAVNTGLAFAAGRDVVLLNSDTVLPPGALARLARAAYADASTGTVTPLTTDGTITTCRTPGRAEPMPTSATLLDLDRAAAHANPRVTIELPTCVAFCTYLRHDCLADTGHLQDSVFAQGYCEENDFSLRAAHLGWRHVAACDVVVAHAGGHSFGPARHALLARNLHILNQLHPGYESLVAAFRQADPLRPIRFALARQIWASGIKPAATILVTHAHSGGVERHVRARVAAIRAAGQRAIVIRPADLYAVSDGADDTGGALIFDTSAALATFLRADNPAAIEIHHLAYHDPTIADLASLLAIPFDIAVHDFAAICPQITLCGPTGRYCGEPLDPQECTYCVADLGAAFPMAGSVAEWRLAQRTLFEAARNISVPSQDAATRLSRYMPRCRMTVMPPEDDAILTAAVPPARARVRAAPVRVAVVGALSVSKGYNVLLACARDAERRALPLRFHVVGHTIDDSRLLATGHVFVSGPFQEGEAQAMLAASRPHMGFLPSVWPETWCYALSELWQAKLRVVAFAIGNQAERIKARSAGVLLPLNAPAASINDVFLAR